MDILLWIILVIVIVNFAFIVSISSFLYKLAEHVDFGDEEEVEVKKEDDSGLVDMEKVGTYDNRYLS